MITETPFLSLPMSEYRARPGISKSGLDLLHRSPAHYQHDLNHPEPPTPAMLFGSMVHKMILEPDSFSDEYAFYPSDIDRRTKDGKAQFAMWEAENAGKIAVSETQLAELNLIADSVRNCTVANNALTDGMAERAMFWQTVTQYGEVNLKARPDYINNDLLIDIKTCLDARSEAFSRQVWNLRYHVQAAVYSDGYRAITGKEPDGFVFIAVEKTPPYAVAVYLANEDMIDQGRREYLADLDVYARCLQNDEWPGYADEVQALVLPRWAQEMNYGY